MGELVAVTRPDGRIYKPRKGPRAVLVDNPDDMRSPFGWVFVLGTHDVDRAFELACTLGEGVERSSATLTWMRLAIRNHELFYDYDPVRGAATVSFEVVG